MCKSLCVKCPTVSPPRPAGKNKCKVDMITVSDLASSENVVTASAVWPTSDVSLLLSSHTLTCFLDCCVLQGVGAHGAVGTQSNGNLLTALWIFAGG